MYQNLLPQPRELMPACGHWVPASLGRVHARGLAEVAVPWLRQDLGGVAVVGEPGPPYAARLGPEAPGPDSGPVALQAPEQPEGYALRVSPVGVEVAGADAAGLWYGLQTAVQLIQSGAESLPAAEIRDWPALGRRGIHLDLKGYQPRFDRLLEACHLLSRYRVNALLLEVEDKLAYEGTPGVGIDGAYTPAQFRELGALCRGLGIEVIPKLQCLGHVDYLLKHARFAHLRENGHPFQYCPRNDEGMALWRDMARELMACFPGHEYFHIGADETGNLGECPVCRQHTKASSYVHRVQQCIDAVLEQGRQPIMWEDILRNLHSNLSEAELDSTWTLGRDAILMYWAYGYGGTGNTFRLLPRYLARDMRVWGASGFSGCGPSWIQTVPPLAERALNIAAWTRTAVESGLEGVVATGWTRIASADPPAEPPEACWLSILYAAESMWRGVEVALDDFIARASRSFFGRDLSGPYGPFLSSGRTTELPCQEVPVPRQGARFDLLRAAAQTSAHDRLRHELQDTLHMYSGRLGSWMPDYRQGLVRGRLERFEASLAEHRHGLTQALGALYEPATVADAVQARFGGDDGLVRRARQLLADTDLEPPADRPQPDGETKGEQR